MELNRVKSILRVKWALLLMRTMKKTIFETKKINMETLPEYLKAAREALSYDPRHVARVTNISEKFLESLENGYYHRLPADVYVFGFLRKLSELYSVESDILVHQFKKERGVHENLAKAKVYQSYKPPKFSLTPKTMIFGTMIVFVLFVLGYLFYQVYAINKPPFLEVFEPRDGARITSSSFVYGINLIK